MKIYRYGLYYDEAMKHTELAVFEVFYAPDAAYTPGWMHSFLSGRMRLHKARLDIDILASLNGKGCVSALYLVQRGTQTYSLFSLRLTLIYALLSFREAFVFIHYKADATCSPTTADDQACRSLVKSLVALSLRLHDFLLIGSDGVYSYRIQGHHGSMCQSSDADTTTFKNVNQAA